MSDTVRKALGEALLVMRNYYAGAISRREVDDFIERVRPLAAIPEVGGTEPVCEETGKRAFRGACIQHGGDACLVMPPADVRERECPVMDVAWWEELLLARFGHGDYLQLNEIWRRTRIKDVAREINAALRALRAVQGDE